MCPTFRLCSAMSTAPMPLSVRRQGSASFVSSGILHFELAFFPLCITLLINYSTCSIKTVLRNLYEADESRTRIACQRALPAIFAFFVLMGASPPAPKKAENISKSTSDRCSQFCRSRFLLRQGKARGEYCRIVKSFNAAWAEICPSKPICVRLSSA